MICSSRYLRFLPAFAFLWMIITCVISFVMAASLGHLNPVWPYISDTGTLAPERCYFSMMLNFEALLIGLIFYCRYMQIQEIMLVTMDKENRTCKHMNVACIIFGVAAAIGISLVANFQETSNFLVHSIGAIMVLGLGTIYFTLHTIVCALMNDGDALGYGLNIFRAVLCCIQFLASILTLYGAHMSLQTVDASGIAVAMHYDPNDPNYIYRVISTAAEWCIGICWGLNLFTLSYDFKYLEFELIFYDLTLDTVES